MPYRRVFLLLDPGWGFARSILRGVREYVRTSRRWVVAQESPTITDMAHVAAWRPDGLIAQVTSVAQVKSLAQLGVPVVNVSAAMDASPFPRVRPDDHAAGRLAAEYLRDRGFRHFAFGGLPQAFSARREAGFASALAAAGLRHDRIHWVRTAPDLPDWLARLPKPVGVVAANDLAAMRVLEACLEASLRVPDDVSVLGIDNDDLICDLGYRTISSVPLPFAEVGLRAARLLDALLDGEAAPRREVLVPPRPVVTRESTDLIAFDAAGEAADVVAALRHIREHLHRRLTVGGVAEAVGTSRRSLERRFKQTVGRTVLQEIIRARVERAQTLLVGDPAGETSMKAIARRCGFGGSKHLSTAFRRVTGQTPTAFAAGVGRDVDPPAAAAPAAGGDRLARASAPRRRPTHR